MRIRLGRKGPLHLHYRPAFRFSALLRRGLAVSVAFVLAFTPLLTFPLMGPIAARAATFDDRDDDHRDRDDDRHFDNDCDLRSARGEIKHVIYIQFDNVHFERDNPNVPSDLEQMPNLLDFVEDNGVLMTNSHTPLISHTADDILTALTGVYGDRHGIPVANSFGFFNPPSSPSFASFKSSFTYWTDPVNNTTDLNPIMLAADGKNAPAPWVPFTRAGCNVGAVSIANMELENVSSDLQNAFASDPAEQAAALAEAKANPDQAVADFEGIAIHCAAGNSVCSSAHHGEPDLLPQEPGGYTGFNALYGHKFVAPVINPGGPLKDLDGNPITDASTPPNPGFPGFGGISAAQTLSYVAAMQEHGVPVTYAYISDAHDNHADDNPTAPVDCKTDPELKRGTANGPGDVCYVAQLNAYNEAFGKFFERLKKDGIDKHNTLFVITADEQDHFAGGPPSPSTCDGIRTLCTYPKIGEIDANITSLLLKEDPSLASSLQDLGTKFSIHFDMAPTFYMKGQPAPRDPLVRKFERAAAKLTAVSPITGNLDQLTRYLADPVEEKLLHMVTADPLRTPTFTMFGNPDYFFLSFGGDPFESPGFAWNHGGVAPEINTVWLGLVGPGIRVTGVDDDTWADHADIRPTILTLVGLKDDYSHQGRALVEAFHEWALPDGVKDSGDEFVELARAYKQINAPLGKLGKTSLRISTTALAGDDDTYTRLESQLSAITEFRDALAQDMSWLLEGAEFRGWRISERDERILVREAHRLLDYVEELAGD